MFKVIFSLLLLVAGNVQACQFIDKRICDIGAVLEQETGHKVTFSVDYTVRVASVEWVVGAPDVIHLGDTKELEDNELFFALAHEFGHSVMRHGRKYVESFGPDAARFESDEALLAKYGKDAREHDAPQELNHSQEYSADAFAAKIMAKHGLDVVKAMKGLLKPLPATNTHPARGNRIAKVKEAM